MAKSLGTCANHSHQSITGKIVWHLDGTQTPAFSVRERTDNPKRSGHKILPRLLRGIPFLATSTHQKAFIGSHTFFWRFAEKVFDRGVVCEC